MIIVFFFMPSPSSSATGGGQTDEHLEAVIDAPLGSRQGTDHEDAQGKASGQQRPGAHVLHRLRDGGSLRVVQVRHQIVSRMRDDGTRDARNVPGDEADSQLGAGRALILGQRHHVLVQSVHRALEGGEFHHRVRNLPPPQRHQPFVQPAHPFLRQQLGHPVHDSLGEGRLSLDPHLHGLKGREAEIGQEFGGGRCGEVEDGFVLEGVVRSHSLRVQVLEELVEAILAGSLDRVAQEGGCPAPEQPRHALLRDRCPEACADTLILDGVDLHVAFHHVHGRHAAVRDPAADHASHGACQKVFRRVEFDSEARWFAEGGDHEVGSRRASAAADPPLWILSTRPERLIFQPRRA
ncbi:hypothetical protein Mapa_017724 [Marchantia paleacea]|nr:hypothetical protein Mapa_017724 [Marchantia paleacea]